MLAFRGTNTLVYSGTFCVVTPLTWPTPATFVQAPARGAMWPTIGPRRASTLATSFHDPNQDYEKAAAQVKSPSAGIVEVILTREGKRAPYVDTDGAFNEYTIIINGVACSNDELPDVIRLDAAVAGPCQDAIVPGGAGHSVTMTVVGTVILSGTVDVRG